jgi:hypothetical protein
VEERRINKEDSLFVLLHPPDKTFLHGVESLVCNLEGKALPHEVHQVNEVPIILVLLESTTKESWCKVDGPEEPFLGGELGPLGDDVRNLCSNEDGIVLHKATPASAIVFQARGSIMKPSSSGNLGSNVCDQSSTSRGITFYRKRCMAPSGNE